MNSLFNRRPRLLIVQAMWGMRQWPSKRAEWSIEKKLSLISEAGFDGIDLDIPLVAGRERFWQAQLTRHGLVLGLQGPFIHSMADFKRCALTVRRMQAPYLDAQVGDYFTPKLAARRLLRNLVAEADRAGVALFIQTHRGRVTQDLYRTIDHCRAIPGLRLNLDLSHYFVSCGFGAEPLPRPAVAAFEALARRTSMIDARVSNGHQVQVDVGRYGRSPYAKPFIDIWKRAMTIWLKQAKPGAVFIFRPELGPPDYSIRDLEGREISDRWRQAIVLAKLGEKIWNDAVAETGRGLPHRTTA